MKISSNSKACDMSDISVLVADCRYLLLVRTLICWKYAIAEPYRQQGWNLYRMKRGIKSTVDCFVISFLCFLRGPLAYGPPICLFSFFQWRCSQSCKRGRKRGSRFENTRNNLLSSCFWAILKSRHLNLWSAPAVFSKMIKGLNWWSDESVNRWIR